MRNLMPVAAESYDTACLTSPKKCNQSEGHLLAIEIRDALYHPALLVLCEFWKYGQGQYFFRGAFGFREVALAISKIDEAGLQVQRDGIVNLRPDLARVQELAQFLAAERANDVLVEDVVRVCGSPRQL